MTGTNEQTVRQATAADVNPLPAVMARAFYGDPPFIWMLPDQVTRLERRAVSPPPSPAARH